MKNKFLEAGQIVNTHGIQGEVKIVPWCDTPEFLCSFDILYIDGAPVRVTAARVGIVEIVQRSDQLILYSDVVGPRQLAAVMDQYPHRVLYNALGRPYFSLRVQPGENPLVLLRDVVTLLPGAAPKN